MTETMTNRRERAQRNAFVISEAFVLLFIRVCRRAERLSESALIKKMLAKIYGRALGLRDACTLVRHADDVKL
jgi:hypothetical protein